MENYDTYHEYFASPEGAVNRDNRESVMRAINEGDPNVVQSISPRLKDDEEVMTAACGQEWIEDCPAVIIPGGLSDRQLKKYLKTVEYPEVASDEACNALFYATDRLKDTDSVVATALKICPSALEYASPRIKASDWAITLAMNTLQQWHPNMSSYEANKICRRIIDN